MSSLIPISTYNLALEPFNPQPALDDDFPVTIRLTMAAVDPEAVDDKEEPSTVRILKKARTFFDEDDEEDYLDIEADEDDEEDELDDEEEEEVAETKKDKKAKKADEEEEEDEEEDEDEEDDSDIDDDDEIEEFVLCTLSPKVQFQQTLDLTISPAEEVHFVVTGSYPVHLTGNYIEHPADDDEDDEDEDDYDQYYEDDDEEDDEEGYNLTPDEDELVDRLEEISDIEGKIEELVEKEANSKKRAAEETSESKKNKKTNEDKKKVQFTENLEQGPTPSKKDKKKAEKAAKAEKADKKEVKKDDKKDDKKEKKFTTNTLLGGVITEDRKVGTGATAKSGNKVGIRYIGKLKNGKVFDKNTSGKPFVFGLGKGECIKGFDLGVAGMAVGGERRVIIPSKMAYGSQALPGIPANSELTFDIKLVSIK